MWNRRIEESLLSVRRYTTDRPTFLSACYNNLFFSLIAIIATVEQMDIIGATYVATLYQM